MKHLFLVLAALALIASACAGSTVEESYSTDSGDDAPASTASRSAASEDSTDPTSSSSPSSEDTSAEEAKPLPEGPSAPDFTLALDRSNNRVTVFFQRGYGCAKKNVHATFPEGFFG